MLDVFLDVMEECGLNRDVSGLSYFSVGDDEEFDEGIREAVTDTLGLETMEVDANAVRYVSQYIRNPAPQKIVWDLGTRAGERQKDSFYWLAADSSVNQGTITASVNTETNTITVEPDEEVNGDFAILFHPELVDVSKPVTIVTPGGSHTVRVSMSEDYLKASIAQNGDPSLACMGEIRYSELIAQE
jgi:hypothetical protein